MGTGTDSDAFKRDAMRRRCAAQTKRNACAGPLTLTGCYVPGGLAVRLHAAFGEKAGEGGFEGDVQIFQRHGQAEVHKRRHAMVADAAGDDAGKVAQVRLDIDRDAVKADPTGEFDINSCDLVPSHACSQARP